MRFRLQACPAAPSGVDSTLTLIMLCEILRPKADERKHATRLVYQTGFTFAKHTPFILTLLSSQPRMSPSPSLQEHDSVLIRSFCVIFIAFTSCVKNKTGSKRSLYINHSGPIKLELLIAKPEQEGILNNKDLPCHDISKRVRKIRLFACLPWNPNLLCISVFPL